MSISTKLVQSAVRTVSTIAPSWTAHKFRKLLVTPRSFKPKAHELGAEKAGERFEIEPGLSAIRWTLDIPGSTSKRAVLVHGWEGRATQMGPLVPVLLSKGYEVIGLDMPAHGNSSGSVTHGIGFAEAILKAEKKLGKIDLLVTHSMGGVASTMAVNKGMQIDAFVMISSPARMDWVMQRMAKGFGLTKKTTHLLVEYMSEFVGIHASAFDNQAFLTDYQKPLLIIHDHNDKEVPISDAERLASGRENTETFFTKGLGHRRILQDEAVKEQLANFIDQQAHNTENYLKSA